MCCEGLGIGPSLDAHLRFQTMEIFTATIEVEDTCIKPNLILYCAISEHYLVSVQTTNMT
jgi:hypothetical protein